MDSIWTVPWNPYGLVHGIHMEWDFIRKFTKSKMNSMFTMDWNPYEINTKDFKKKKNFNIYILYI